MLNVLGVYPGDPGPPGGDCAATWRPRGGSCAPAGRRRCARPWPRGARLRLAVGRPPAGDRSTESLSFEQACTLPTTWMHRPHVASRGEAGGWAQRAAACRRGRRRPRRRRSTRTGLAPVSRPASGGRTSTSTCIAWASPAAPSAPATEAPSRSARRGCSAQLGCASRSTACRRTSSPAPSPCCGRTAGCARSASGRCGATSGSRRRPCRGTWRSRSTRPSSRRQPGCVELSSCSRTARTPLCCTACRCRPSSSRGACSRPFARCRAAPTRARWWFASRRRRRRRREGRHLLSGGTGGLGLVTGRWLGERGAASVVLAARGGRVATVEGERLKKLARCDFSVAKCDAAEPADTAR